MKKMIITTITVAGFAATAVGLAAPTLAATGQIVTAPRTLTLTLPAPLSQTDSQDGTVALPPGAPIAIYPAPGVIGGANPYVPFGTDPYAPYGVWNQ
jgi:hypothetical protein